MRIKVKLRLNNIYDEYGFDSWYDMQSFLEKKFNHMKNSNKLWMVIEKEKK